MKHRSHPRFNATPFFSAIWRLRTPATLGLLSPSLALAGPTGADVVGGNVNVTTPDATHTVINQSTQSAVVNWQQFNVNGNEYVIFQQPNSSAAILNRVIGGDPSTILGNITANGRVFIINPQGIIFGQGAKIDVGGLVASTLDIKNNDFMSGRYVFAGDSKAGVVNQGTITASDNGFVALVGDNVSNSGVIQANLGKVLLASGSAVTLDVDGNGLVNYQISEAALSERAGVENVGEIIAQGGAVIMSAKTASELARTTVNNSGLIKAQGISSKGGDIYLTADGGSVENSGTLDASGKNGNDGGKVIARASGNIRHSGKISVTGKNGGEARLVAEKKLTTTQDSVIDARADDPATGKGGFVELSGHESFELGGQTLIGKGGTLLIDPTTLTIMGSYGDSNYGSYGSYGSNYYDTGSSIYENQIESWLDQGSNVVLVATQGIDTAGTFTNGINSSGYGNLTIGIGHTDYDGSFIGEGGVAGSGPGYGINLLLTNNNPSDPLAFNLNGRLAVYGGSSYGGVKIGGVTAKDILIQAHDGIDVEGDLTSTDNGYQGEIVLNAGQDIKAGNIAATGYVSVSSTGGGIEAGSISAGDHLNDGDLGKGIYLSAHNGISTSGGLTSTDRNGAYGDRIQVITDTGNISIGGSISGSAIELEANGGNVSAINSDNNPADITAQDGYITIQSAGTVTAGKLSATDKSYGYRGQVDIHAAGAIATGDIDAGGYVFVTTSNNGITTGGIQSGNYINLYKDTQGNVGAYGDGRTTSVGSYGIYLSAPGSITDTGGLSATESTDGYADIYVHSTGYGVSVTSDIIGGKVDIGTGASSGDVHTSNIVAKDILINAYDQIDVVGTLKSTDGDITLASSNNSIVVGPNLVIVDGPVIDSDGNVTLSAAHQIGLNNAVEYGGSYGGISAEGSVHITVSGTPPTGDTRGIITGDITALGGDIELHTYSTTASDIVTGALESGNSDHPYQDITVSSAYGAVAINGDVTGYDITLFAGKNLTVGSDNSGIVSADGNEVHLTGRSGIGFGTLYVNNVDSDETVTVTLDATDGANGDGQINAHQIVIGSDDSCDNTNAARVSLSLAADKDITLTAPNSNSVTDGNNAIEIYAGGWDAASSDSNAITVDLHSTSGKVTLGDVVLNAAQNTISTSGSDQYGGWTTTILTGDVSMQIGTGDSTHDGGDITTGDLSLAGYGAVNLTLTTQGESGPASITTGDLNVTAGSRDVTYDYVDSAYQNEYLQVSHTGNAAVTLSAISYITTDNVSVEGPSASFTAVGQKVSVGNGSNAQGGNPTALSVIGNGESLDITYVSYGGLPTSPTFSTTYSGDVSTNADARILIAAYTGIELTGDLNAQGTTANVILSSNGDIHIAGDVDVTGTGYEIDGDWTQWNRLVDLNYSNNNSASLVGPAPVIEEMLGYQNRGYQSGTVKSGEALFTVIGIPPPNSSTTTHAGQITIGDYISENEDDDSFYGGHLTVSGYGNAAATILATGLNISSTGDDNGGVEITANASQIDAQQTATNYSSDPENPYVATGYYSGIGGRGFGEDGTAIFTYNGAYGSGYRDVTLGSLDVSGPVATALITGAHNVDILGAASVEATGESYQIELTPDDPSAETRLQVLNDGGTGVFVVNNTDTQDAFTALFAPTTALSGRFTAHSVTVTGSGIAALNIAATTLGNDGGTDNPQGSVGLGDITLTSDTGHTINYDTNTDETVEKNIGYAILSLQGGQANTQTSGNGLTINSTDNGSGEGGNVLINVNIVRSSINIHADGALMDGLPLGSDGSFIPLPGYDTPSLTLVAGATVPVAIPIGGGGVTSTDNPNPNDGSVPAAPAAPPAPSAPEFSVTFGRDSFLTSLTLNAEGTNAKIQLSGIPHTDPCGCTSVPTLALLQPRPESTVPSGLFITGGYTANSSGGVQLSDLNVLTDGSIDIHTTSSTQTIPTGGGFQPYGSMQVTLPSGDITIGATEGAGVLLTAPTVSLTSATGAVAIHNTIVYAEDSFTLQGDSFVVDGGSALFGDGDASLTATNAGVIGASNDSLVNLINFTGDTTINAGTLSVQNVSIDSATLANELSDTSNSDNPPPSVVALADDASISLLSDGDLTIGNGVYLRSSTVSLLADGSIVRDTTGNTQSLTNGAGSAPLPPVQIDAGALSVIAGGDIDLSDAVSFIGNGSVVETPSHDSKPNAAHGFNAVFDANGSVNFGTLNMQNTAYLYVSADSVDGGYFGGTNLNIAGTINLDKYDAQDNKTTGQLYYNVVPADDSEPTILYSQKFNDSVNVAPPYEITLVVGTDNYLGDITVTNDPLPNVDPTVMPLGLGQPDVDPPINFVFLTQGTKTGTNLLNRSGDVQILQPTGVTTVPTGESQRAISNAEQDQDTRRKKGNYDPNAGDPNGDRDSRMIQIRTSKPLDLGNSCT